MKYQIKNRSEEANMRSRMNGQEEKVNIFCKGKLIHTCLRSEADEYVQRCLMQDRVFAIEGR